MKEVKVVKNNKIYLLLLILVAAGFASLGITLGYILFKGFNQTTIVNKQEKEVTVNENGIADAVDKVYDAVMVVEIYNNGKIYGTGTGFIYKKDGNSYYAITNHHVVKSASDVKVILTNGDEISVKVVGSDQYNDIAVLKFESNKDLKVAEIGSSIDSRLGDTVFTVGAPVSSSTFSGSVTRGIISGKDRLVTVRTTDTGNMDYEMKVLQTDAAINSGNSGGPLCNSNGQVIGVTNMKLASASIEGMGFAVPIEDAISYAEKLTNGEDTSRPYIGVSLADVSQAMFIKFYYDISIPENVSKGVVVIETEKGSASDKAGLTKGDVVTKIGNEEVSSVAEFKYQLYKYNIGDKVSITYNRGGVENVCEITLGSK